ncbi:MAG: hypothetical protein WCP03_03700 [Candidatus Saccharibacteria bacterium]
MSDETINEENSIHNQGTSHMDSATEQSDLVDVQPVPVESGVEPIDQSGERIKSRMIRSVSIAHEICIDIQNGGYDTTGFAPVLAVKIYDELKLEETTRRDKIKEQLDKEESEDALIAHQQIY